MQFWIIQTLNSLALGGLLFLLSSGFSLIFGLMRIANLTHGALFMLGAYVGVSVLKFAPNLWLAALLAGLVVALFGGLLERFILRALAGNALGQVLVTLGFAFIIADFCLIVWGGDPIPVPTPESLRKPLIIAGVAFPSYRLAVIGIAVVTAIALYLLMERTRLGAMIRAGVDDMQMARASESRSPSSSRSSFASARHSLARAASSAVPYCPHTPDSTAICCRSR